jgi:ankyrin repeat protein
MDIFDAIDEGNEGQVSQIAHDHPERLNDLGYVIQPPQTQNRMWLTPLLYGVMRNNPSMVRSLLDNGANPSHRNPSGLSPLMIAAENGSIELVQILLDAGAEIGENVYNYVEPGSIINNTIRNRARGGTRKRNYRRKTLRRRKSQRRRYI